MYGELRLLSCVSQASSCISPRSSSTLAPPCRIATVRPKGTGLWRPAAPWEIAPGAVVGRGPLCRLHCLIVIAHVPGATVHSSAASAQLALPLRAIRWCVTPCTVAPISVRTEPVWSECEWVLCDRSYVQAPSYIEARAGAFCV